MWESAPRSIKPQTEAVLIGTSRYHVCVGPLLWTRHAVDTVENRSSEAVTELFQQLRFRTLR